MATRAGGFLNGSEVSKHEEALRGPEPHDEPPLPPELAFAGGPPPPGSLVGAPPALGAMAFGLATAAAVCVGLALLFAAAVFFMPMVVRVLLAIAGAWLAAGGLAFAISARNGAR